MKGIISTGCIRLSLLTALIGICLASSPATAQDRQERADSSDQGNRITIVVDPDGSVTVNGEAARAGAQKFDLGPGGGQVVVINPDGRDRFFSFKEPLRFEFQPGDEFKMPAPDVIKQKLDALRLKDFPMKEIRPFFEDMDFLNRENAETMRMEQEARDLARRYREAEGAERQQLERALREKLNQEFDQKMELRRERTERLRKELKEQQERLQKRQTARDEIIERHLKDLVGEEDVLDW